MRHIKTIVMVAALACALVAVAPNAEAKANLREGIDGESVTLLQFIESLFGI